MFTTSDTFSATPLWSNGPTPGGFYNFPSTRPCPDKITQHFHTPMTTGSSVIGMKFKGGIIIAADMLGSYGSLARFRNVSRILKVNDNVVLGAGGDYADFQYLKALVEQKIIDEECLNDGFSLKPKSLYCWMTRVMYNRRSKIDPLWNTFVVGGLQDGEPFLGSVDYLGMAYEDKAVCTGFGAHMANPLIRDFLEKNPEPTEAEARNLIHKCMEILFYRDARSYPKYQFTVLTKDGASIEGPVRVKDNWDLATMIKA